ncbi:hypothetical protein B0T25DRAFT_509932 [Lasiosphaeria hispida]|uniref:NAD(P)-binding domain-containing protein n=1 Tax=Lasiosphaeria hispida TaxID=260671 RepID=A0AAJ0M7U7_9PEZI|nr:hypothetical protein B0T25DRAFT_509932 [Lasiosphaeria hispida]
MTTSQTNPVLVLGGTGTVGSRIAKQLSAASVPALAASRNGTGADGVVFDWEDRKTWENPFKAAAKASSKGRDEATGNTSGSSRIKSVFLLAPPVLDSAPIMMEFVDFARQRGARRFVLLSASAIEAGEPAMGKVHAYLRELGCRGEVDWAVLRPTWFQQNVAEQEGHVRSLREESKLYSATGEGKIPWVSADDIAAVAVQALTRKDPPNTEFVILGPQLLSYDDLAEILTELLGRKIVHVDLSTRDLEERHQSLGMPENYARMMSSLDNAIKVGSENRVNDVVLSVTGRAPKPFREFAESVKSVWEPAVA